ESAWSGIGDSAVALRRPGKVAVQWKPKCPAHWRRAAVGWVACEQSGSRYTICTSGPPRIKISEAMTASSTVLLEHSNEEATGSSLGDGEGDEERDGGRTPEPLPRDGRVKLDSPSHLQLQQSIK
ncbi:Protein of unknown function, partial [Gryllus bimaculatus]